MNAIKADHERRVAALDQKARERTRAAELVAMNAWIVDRAISVIRQAVDSGMDWEALERLLQRERDMGDDVAELVVGLKLDVNKITLRLHEDLADAGASSDDSSSDSDDDGNKRALRPMKIDVDITLSAHGNARKLFEDKKLAKEKASRTREASEKVISDLAEKADQAVQRELKRKNATQGIRESRKAMWFEKFDWFVTSEGLLVISGRDAQQNELLVKRYLRASHGDVYVHADIHGAATCILRNPFGKGSTLPAESLRQAGAMAVARSAAWGAKVIAGAWWVHASQVSKTAPSGEYLSTGSFMVRGKKNYLPPAKLELGFGFIFKVDVTALGDGEDEVATVNPPPNVWRFMRDDVDPMEVSTSEDAVDLSIIDIADEGEGEIFTPLLLVLRAQKRRTEREKMEANATQRSNASREAGKKRRNERKFRAASGES